MCETDQRESRVKFHGDPRVLRELFVKNHGGPFAPYKCD